MSLTTQFGIAARNDVSQITAKAQDHELTILNLEKSVGADAVGQQSRVAFAGKGSSLSDDKKKRDRIDALLRQQLLEAMRRADELSNLIQIRLEEIRAKITEKQNELSEISADIDALDEAIKKIEQGEGIELNAEGKLKDARLQKIIEQWQSDNDKKEIDLTNPALLYSIMKKEADNNEKEKLAKQNQLHEDTQEEQKLLKAQEKIDKIKEKLKSDDPEKQREAIKELDDPLLKEIAITQAVHEGNKVDNAIIKNAKVNDTKQEEFAFKAPPLKSEFTKSASGEPIATIAKIEQENKPIVTLNPGMN